MSLLSRPVGAWFCVLLFGLCLLLAGNAPVYADDGIFPPAPAAKPFIDFDGKGFLVEGKRTFIVSGSMHYPRVPRALWRDRLLRIKRAGFNTVETYTFWNVHEPQEGKWEFTGEKDFNAYLQLIHELGMYAIVRVGPYVCAEWDSGGYPVWLRFKPGIKVREDNPQFEAAVDRWYEKILPIVAANQIHKGGAVLMVQLENEHPQGWGKEMPNNYFKHLRAKALSLGLEVPYFFSGLHHGAEPAGDKPWDSKGRTNPWFSTEFWPGWYSYYGPLSANDLLRFDRGTWRILAYGGNGYNYYMLHGGTNFAFWNNDEDASSYDYSAAIGQAGDLRPIYYRFKRAALFARTFADILENSESDNETYKDIATHPAAFVTARKSPAGTLIFLENNTVGYMETQIKGAGDARYPRLSPFTLRPGEILPIVKDYPLLPDVTLELGAARILGIARQGDTTTLVIYSNPTLYSNAGDSAYMRFRIPAQGVKILRGVNGLDFDPDDKRNVILSTEFPTDEPLEYLFSVGKQRIRILAMSGSLADRAWFVEQSGKQYVVWGPEYLADFDFQAPHPHLTAEAVLRPDNSGLPTYKALIYGAEETPLLLQQTHKEGDPSAFMPPQLSSWQARRGDAEAQSGYFTGSWKSSDSPLPMGADGDTSAYAWYRTFVYAPTAGNYTLAFSDAGDWLQTFINGESSGSSKIKPRGYSPVPEGINVTLQAGQNTLAVLAVHYGRPKLFNFLGPIDTVDVKGVNGPVYLSRSATGSVSITAWRTLPDRRPKHDLPDTLPAEARAAFTQGQAVPENGEVFQNHVGFAWVVSTLPAVPGPNRRIHFENVDDNATVYLNGKKLAHHEGWSKPFDVNLTPAWKEGGTNELAVLVENTSGPGGIMGDVTLITAPVGDAKEIRAWKMRGGLGDPQGELRQWQPVKDDRSLNIPAYYRAEFVAPPPAALGPHPILRVALKGMSRGFVWLNGHNLGRYPEKVPVEGIWLPECWLSPGRNTLILFDEEGKSPAQISLYVEERASRSLLQLSR